MANQLENPTPETVADCFVGQYYQFLDQSPENLHRFYQPESSVLTRPEPDGKGMKSSYATVQAVNNMRLSMEYKNYQVHVMTADSQLSLNGGIIVLVTGYLIPIAKENEAQRKFTQTFFLAPQENGYFVLNDIFNYVDDVASNVLDETTPKAPNHVVTEPSGIADLQPVLSHCQTTCVEVNNTNAKQVNNTSGKESVTENSVGADIPVESRQNLAPEVTETAASNASQADAPAVKKSFAAVVSALNENKGPFTLRKPQPNPVQQRGAPVMPKALPPLNNSAVAKNNVPSAKANAIYVGNLPMNATTGYLKMLFKQFGPIKRDGVQVICNKQQGSCFGFVDFESCSCMQSAIKASPLVDGNFKLHIKESRANNDRGRFPSGRENYDLENYSGGGGNCNAGRGYGRSDMEKRVDHREFTRQNRGNATRNGEACQRPYQYGGKAVRHSIRR